jgi:hypothetical protein
MRTKAVCLALTIVLLIPVASAQWVKTTGMDSCEVHALAVSGTNLFAGTHRPNGVFMTTNNGASWTAVSNGLPNQVVSTLVVSGMNLFAGTYGDGVFLSTNNGSTWNAVNSGLVPSPGMAKSYVYVLALSGTNLLAGTHGGVLVSTNNGASWTTFKSGLDDPVFDLAVCDTFLIAATAGTGVFRVSNADTSWRESNSGLTCFFVPALAVSTTHLFAATCGVSISTNSGASWTSVESGLTKGMVTAFAVWGTNLFAGTEGGGVFLSTNNGESWSAVDSGLTNVSVLSLAISGTNLFAGTYPKGVWKRRLSEMITSVDPVMSELPHEFLLSQNYPNPFNPSTTIKFELPKASQVSLTVYDILGRAVSVLVNESKGAGAYEVKFDGSNLASGVYIYRLQAGDFVQSKRLLLLK